MKNENKHKEFFSKLADLCKLYDVEVLEGPHAGERLMVKFKNQNVYYTVGSTCFWDKEKEQMGEPVLTIGRREYNIWRFEP